MPYDCYSCGDNPLRSSGEWCQYCKDNVAKLQAQVKKLAEQKQALIDHCMRYAGCDPDCTFGKEQSKECTCGWIKDHKVLGELLFSTKP